MRISKTETEFVKEEMKRTGYTQVMVARHLGISQQGLSKKISKGRFEFTEMVILFNLFKTSNERILELCNGQQ